jgi:P-type E1-E2 ATPase
MQVLRLSDLLWDRVTVNRRRIGTALLTGDTRRVANAVAANLGIERVESELLPEQKLERIGSLISQKRVVAMVGDG